MVSSGSAIAADQADESQAVREIEQLGGQVTRDDKAPGRPVTAVSFEGEATAGRRFGDEDLYRLVAFKELTTLHFQGSWITDAELRGTRRCR